MRTLNKTRHRLEAAGMATVGVVGIALMMSTLFPTKCEAIDLLWWTRGRCGCFGSDHSDCWTPPPDGDDPPPHDPAPPYDDPGGGEGPPHEGPPTDGQRGAYSLTSKACGYTVATTSERDEED